MYPLPEPGRIILTSSHFHFNIILSPKTHLTNSIMPGFLFCHPKIRYYFISPVFSPCIFCDLYLINEPRQKADIPLKGLFIGHILCYNTSNILIFKIMPITGMKLVHVSSVNDHSCVTSLHILFQKENLLLKPFLQGGISSRENHISSRGLLAYRGE
jgi:hypothetical protein